MYSKVKIFGHSLHPMLVVFPIAFYTATFVTFIVYAATDSMLAFRFAALCNWVGVGAALLAAVPGFIDWAVGIPRKTQAKRHGAIHMVLNVLALAAFTASAVFAGIRWGAAQPDPGWNVALSAIGIALTLPAGFLGWTLVQKHHVGVELTPEQERLDETTRRAERPRVRPPAEQQT